MAVRQAGFTAAAEGKQGYLAWLPDKFENEAAYPATTIVGKVRGARRDLVSMGQAVSARNDALHDAQLHGSYV